MSAIARKTQTSLFRGANVVQQRFLNLHEYQSLDVFQKFGVPVPKFQVAKTLSEVDSGIAKFDGDIVLKSQILAGGRGLGTFVENGFKGGVHVCSSKDQVKDYAAKMLGNTLQTKQNALQVNTLLLMEKFEISKEKYFAILMDRASGGPVLIGSKTGGTSIEDIAHEDPDSIVRISVDIMEGLSETQALEMAEKMDFVGEMREKAAESIMGLYRVFIECDCTMVEINPMSELKDGRVIVCDAKVNFDDNAEFRQKEIHSQRDTTQEDARELEASKFDLNYIGLDGSIGCMVNGAGLAMSTMDLLKLFGGEPANFLDVGGSAQVHQIKAAFSILQDDPKVKSMFVNIFGGIMRCDVIADGIVQAASELGLKKPVVVRLEGTNVEEGGRILKESGLAIHFHNDFTEGAKKAVELTL